MHCLSSYLPTYLSIYLLYLSTRYMFLISFSLGIFLSVLPHISCVKFLEFLLIFVHIFLALLCFGGFFSQQRKRSSVSSFVAKFFCVSVSFLFFFLVFAGCLLCNALCSSKMSDEEMTFCGNSCCYIIFLWGKKRKSRAQRYWIHLVISNREKRDQLWVMYSDLHAHEEKK